MKNCKSCVLRNGAPVWSTLPTGTWLCNKNAIVEHSNGRVELRELECDISYISCKGNWYVPTLWQRIKDWIIR